MTADGTTFAGIITKHNHYFTNYKHSDIMALQITDSNFEQLLAEGKPMVVDFWANWWGPCKKVGPFIEQLAEEYADQALIG